MLGRSTFAASDASPLRSRVRMLSQPLCTKAGLTCGSIGRVLSWRAKEQVTLQNYATRGPVLRGFGMTAIGYIPFPLTNTFEVYPFLANPYPLGFLME